MSDRQKYLFVTSSLDSGGAERWVFNTLKAHGIPEGVGIDYYFYRGVEDDLLLGDYQAMGVKVSFRHLDLRGRIGELVSLYFDLKRFVKKNGPYHAVHINGTPLVFQVLVLLAANRTNVKVRIVHNHNPKSSSLGLIGSVLRALLREIIKRNATIVASCSNDAAQRKYGKEILASPKYKLLKNGVDLSRFTFNREHREQVRTELGISQDAPLILHIGRFEKEKNHHFLLECFDRFQLIHPDARLLLIGEGSLKDSISARIEQMELSDKVFLIEQTNTPEAYYSAADCFVLPSLYEGLGYVCIESLACGCPVVLSDCIPMESWRARLVSRVPLEKNADEWAACIASSIVEGRIDCNEIIEKRGYSLTSTSNDFFHCLQEDE